MNTVNTLNILDSIIPISLFNKGKANQIFSDVKKTGIRVVVKNNTPECVLLSPENYQKMIDEYEDAMLLNEALKRLSESATYISQEDILKKEGITVSDLNNVEVEIE